MQTSSGTQRKFPEFQKIIEKVLVMLWRTRIVCVLVAISVLRDVAGVSAEAAEKKKTKEHDKWHPLLQSSESEIASNYVSQSTSTKLSKDSSTSAVVSNEVEAVPVHRKNQFRELQAQIQKQLPKESKFFDEFEGSEFRVYY